MMNKRGGVYALSAFIVEKRKFIFFAYLIMAIFCAFSRNWTVVEDSMAAYLSDSTETRQGLDLMEEQFTTFGTCDVMICNISYEQGEKIAKSLEAIDGVYEAKFEDNAQYYKNGCGKFAITFKYDEDSEDCEDALDSVKEFISDYDYYINTDIGNPEGQKLIEEMGVVTVIAIIIVIAILLITTEAFAEIPLLLITFGSAALLQMGTNFFFTKISFVSNSVTAILQLALSIDYAVILLNRYKEERVALDAKEAAIVALSKAIPEISGSCLTTIGGLLAMCFMQYKMGLDLGVVLVKAILIAIITVFVLMPGLLVAFDKLMAKTKHRSFIPKISFVGRFASRTMFIVPPLFIIIIIAAYFVSNNVDYKYGEKSIDTISTNENAIAREMINNNFEITDPVALIVPKGDYDAERSMIAELEKYSQVDSITGLSNIDAKGYTLTSELSPREFAELTDIDYESIELLYAAYCVDNGEYGRIVGGISAYKVPLMDMFMFVKQEIDEGYITLDDDMMTEIDELYDELVFAKAQLLGDEYTRIIVYLNLPEGSSETLEFLDTMETIMNKYYSGQTVLECGNSVSQKDLKSAFATDNIVVTVVSILAVLAVLFFTFKSVGMPVLLIIVIQGCIFINFSFNTITSEPIFFLSYLIVSSIQMGANIDYAIVIASRYLELRETMDKKEAIIDTMNLSFPTIVTSGPMLALAGFSIGFFSSVGSVYNIGMALGRGTLISIMVTLFVLPQILLLGDMIISKTAIKFNLAPVKKEKTGYMRIRGGFHGYINGEVSGNLDATIKGNISGKVDIGDVETLSREKEADHE